MPLNQVDYRQLIEMAIDGFCLMDSQGSILDANGSFCKLVGYDLEQLLAMPFSDLEPCTSQNSLQRMSSNELKKGLRIESQLCCSDGRMIDVELNSRIDPSQTDFRAVFIRDITELKSKEKAQRESEFFFEESQRAAMIGSYKADFVADHWESSSVLDEIFGIDEKYVRSVQNWLEIVHPDDRNEVHRYLQNEVLENKAPFCKEYRIIRKNDGQNRWVRGLGEVRFDDQGRSVSLIGTVQNITLQKQSEEVLQETLDLFSFFMAHSPAYVFIKEVSEKESKVLRVSENYVEMIGIPAKEMAGKTMSDLFPPDLAESMTKDDWNVVLSQKPMEIEEEFNGKIYYTIKFPLSRAEKFLLAGYTLDITERKQVEAALLKSKEQAEAANKAKSQFLANMSHELRTPLNPIIGFAEILADAPNLSPSQKELVETVRRRGNDLLGLISDILDFSRIEAQKVELDPYEMKLSHFIEDLENAMGPLAKKKGLWLKLSMQEGLPNSVIADGLRLRQVLFNLIGNAIKFTHSGGVIVQLMKAEPSDLLRPLALNELALLFTVQDTGIGIDSNMQDHIFETFHQADNSHSREYGGSGLGLPIAKKLCSMMGGKIWVESQKGSGSTFRFSTIIGESGQNMVLQTNLNQSGTERCPLNILVVDDDSDSRCLVELYLNKRGDFVQSACDGQEALEILVNHRFDAVLMDIQMPVMNGLEATRLLREREKLSGDSTLVIALTAHAVRSDRDKFLKAGLNYHLSKPISSKKLYETLDQLVGARRIGVNLK